MPNEIFTSADKLIEHLDESQELNLREVRLVTKAFEEGQRSQRAETDSADREKRRQQRIRHAVIDCKGVFPKQLLGSGVMFFDGERIEIEEFQRARELMGRVS